MKPILTIAIPSYDRPRELTETLRKLAANKIPDGIEILIIDNCSPSVLEDELSGGWPDDSPPIRWIRNPANIGLAANLLRVFEHSCGDWIWILGDDDPPLPDAVARIISAIGNAPEQCTLLKFNSTNGGEVSKTTDLGTPSDLAQKCRDPKFYSNLLFISSSVARRDRYIEKLGVGYHYAYSVAPHIAMLLSLVQDGCSVD